MDVRARVISFLSSVDEPQTLGAIVSAVGGSHESEIPAVILDLALGGGALVNTGGISLSPSMRMYFEKVREDEADAADATDEAPLPGRPWPDHSEESASEYNYDDAPDLALDEEEPAEVGDLLTDGESGESDGTIAQGVSIQEDEDDSANPSFTTAGREASDVCNSQQVGYSIDGPIAIDSGDLLDWDDIDFHLRIFAGPGAGKTHFLTQNIKGMIERWPLGRDGRILCITYTNAAAREISDRIGNLAGRLLVSTIHSFIARELVARYQEKCRKVIAEDFGVSIPDSIEIKGPREGRPFLTRAQKRKVREFLEDDVRTQLDGLTDTVFQHVEVDIAGYADTGRKAISADAAGIDERFAEELKHAIWLTTGVITFDEILYLGWRLIEADEEVLQGLVNAFPYVFVDEFQDTNPIQALIVEKMGESGSIVGVIGDVAQSIYSFQGARPTMFESFKVPGTRPTVDYRILGNRRSAGNIVAFSNFLRQKDQIVQEALRNDENDAEVIFLAGRGGQTKSIVESLLADGAVVLTRTWAQAFAHLPGVSPFQAGLLKQIYSYYFPYDVDLRSEVESGGSIRWTRAYRLLVDLEQAARSANATACLAALRKYGRAREPYTLDTGLEARALEFSRACFADVGDETPVHEVALEATRRLASEEYASLVNACFRSGSPKVDDSGSARLTNLLYRLEWGAVRKLYVDLFSANPSITTAHQSKGREWDVVVVDLLPSRYDSTTLSKMFRTLDIVGEGPSHEFTRLFYVACTRARERLYICLDNNEEVKEAVRSALDDYMEASGRKVRYSLIEDSSVREARSEAMRSVVLPPTPATEEEDDGLLAGSGLAQSIDRRHDKATHMLAEDEEMLEIPACIPDNLEVEILFLPVRTIRMLQNQGIQYITDFEGITFGEIKDYPHSGPIITRQIFHEVKRVVEKYLANE